MTQNALVIDTDDDGKVNVAALCKKAKENKIAAARKKRKKQYNTAWKPWFHKKPFELMNGYNHVCEKCGRKLTQCLCIE